MEIFPEFAEEGHAKLIKLDEDSQKSPDGKEKWRKFIAKYVLLLMCTLDSLAEWSHKVRENNQRL